MKMKVDLDLVEICKVVIAGLDGDLSLLPGIEKQLSKSYAETKKYLRDMVMCTDDCDIIQNNKWYGSKEKDGTYKFYLWGQDSRGNRQRVNLISVIFSR